MKITILNRNILTLSRDNASYDALACLSISARPTTPLNNH